MEIVEGVLNIGPFRAATRGMVVLFIGRWPDRNPDKITENQIQINLPCHGPG